MHGRQPRSGGSARREAVRREHAEGRPFRRFRGAERPASLDEGYRVQDLLNRRFAEAGRGATAGYKVGLTSEAIQTMYGSDQPISGVVFETGVHRSPARIPLGDYTHLGMEFELAVEIGGEFRPEDAPFSLDDARDRVAACMPAFELIEDRQRRPRRRRCARHPHRQFLVRRCRSGAVPHRLALARPRQHPGLAQGQRRPVGCRGHRCGDGESAQFARLARQPSRHPRRRRWSPA